MARQTLKNNSILASSARVNYLQHCTPHQHTGLPEILLHSEAFGAVESIVGKNFGWVVMFPGRHVYWREAIFGFVWIGWVLGVCSSAKSRNMAMTGDPWDVFGSGSADDEAVPDIVVSAAGELPAKH